MTVLATSGLLSCFSFVVLRACFMVVDLPGNTFLRAEVMSVLDSLAVCMAMYFWICSVV